MSVESALDLQKEPPDRYASLAPMPCRTRAKAASPRRTASFLKKHFPQASKADFNNWRWQIANRITSPEAIENIIALSPDERAAVTWRNGALPFAVTPYYASLLDRNDPASPLRRTVIPTTLEHLRSPGEADDPLGEDHHSPVPGLVHRYPDRVLFLATTYCSTYCRYCTRSRMVGGAHAPSPARWEKALAYIEATPTVRDVLVSGGDPLTMADEALAWLLASLRRIPHVQVVRIGTKVPAVLPQRVTKELARMLKKFHPLWMSLHFAHPDELTRESTAACERLADAGIPLGSQTVLLKGVNDDTATLKGLYHGLMRCRVKPYYLYQCDPISGSEHFRTSVDKGLEVISGLRGHTSGYAVPTYVIDAPGGGGKIPLYPNTVTGRDEAGVHLKNYEGKHYLYPDRPAAPLGAEA